MSSHLAHRASHLSFSHLICVASVASYLCYNTSSHLDHIEVRHQASHRISSSSVESHVCCITSHVISCRISLPAEDQWSSITISHESRTELSTSLVALSHRMSPHRVKEHALVFLLIHNKQRRKLWVMKYGTGGIGSISFPSHCLLSQIILKGQWG